MRDACELSINPSPNANPAIIISLRSPHFSYNLLANKVENAKERLVIEKLSQQR